jgi:hypothetical protein
VTQGRIRVSIGGDDAANCGNPVTIKPGASIKSNSAAQAAEFCAGKN